MRNKLQRANAKKLLRKPKGKFKAVDFGQHPPPDWMTRAFINNRYVVMIEDDVPMSNGTTAVKAMIQRHDDKPIPHHWRELQSIKNELFGKESLGAEFYPPQSMLTDCANIYWLWILQPGDMTVPADKDWIDFNKRRSTTEIKGDDDE